MTNPVEICALHKKKRSDHICYMDFQLKFEGDSVSSEEGKMRAVLYSAMMTLHGMVGLGHDPDLKYFDPDSGRGIIAINSMYASKLWTALTLKGDVDGKKCCITVLDIKDEMDSLKDTTQCV
uniref:Uncharacterized protein n=1 Tax=Ciona intestinalis TaxID=7719 RepID=H2Y0S1_CIOIN